MKDLPNLSALPFELERILTLPSDETLQIELAVEGFSAKIIDELKNQSVMLMEINDANRE